MFNITGAIRLVAEGGSEWFTEDAEVTRAVREYLKAKKAADAADALKKQARDALLSVKAEDEWKAGDKLRTPAGTVIVSVTNPVTVDSARLKEEFPLVYAKVARDPRRTVSVRVNGA